MNTKKNKSIEELLPEIDKEVDELIEILNDYKETYLAIKNSKSTIGSISIYHFDSYIENKLDYLLMPFTKKQFHKLLYYWEELNPKSEKKYRQAFNDLYK